MFLFPVLKILLCSWVLLLIIQSITNDVISMILLSGTIITSIPMALMLAWVIDAAVFRAVFLFSLFTILVITLHVMQLGLM
ncbi:MAG: hypothetical protein ACXACF_02635 [Candidatus Hermodarchaeia archaeon]|jgi:hypothetical protein